MENKYLEKIANQGLYDDMHKNWTVLGQKETMLRHGYNVPYGEMMAMNASTANAQPVEDLKDAGKGAVVGVGIGGLVGAALAGKEGAMGGALLGGSIGMLGEMIHGQTVRLKDNQKEYLHRAIESGAYNKYRIGEKQASFNPFLEKIATNKMKQHLMADKSTTSSGLFGLGKKTTTTPGASFGDSRAGGASNASIMSSHANTAPSASYKSNGTHGKSILTGDSTVAGKSLGQRLEGFKVNKATAAAGAAKTGVKGILSKAVGLVKRNPLTAAGTALGAGLLAGRMGKKSDPQYQYA